MTQDKLSPKYSGRFNPRMLKHYTDLRGEAFAAGALSSRDKDDLIMAVNVARLYAPRCSIM